MSTTEPPTSTTEVTPEPARGRGRPTGPAGPGGGRQRPPRRNVTVSEVIHLTPQLTRLVATGELANWNPGTPGGHFKVFVPMRGIDELSMRTYTVRSYDREHETLTIDFGLHSDGPATAFARHAKPGDSFQVSGEARTGYAPSEDAAWCVFFADHSALPAVAAIAESLPAGFHAHAVIEIPDAAEQLPFSSDADLHVSWIPQAGEPCEQLAAAAKALTLPAGDGEVWVGCEAGAMRQIRAHLLHERELSPRALHTRAYWKRGTVNHSDHDTGEDDS